MTKRPWFALGVCVLAPGLSGTAGAGEIGFGVQNGRGADKAKAQGNALGKFLPTQTADTITLVPATAEDTAHSVKRGAVDRMPSNPVRSRYGNPTR